MAKTPDDRRLELLQGTLDMLILRTLQWGPQHGHGIGQAIRAQSDDLLKVETGSLYPALHRLEKRGWLKSEWGVSEANQRAKYYRLTAAGQGAAAARAGSLVAARRRDRPHHEPGAGGQGVAHAARPSDDLDDEIRGHLALSVKERIERGEDPEAARLAALREFGNVTLIARLDAARLAPPLARRGRGARRRTSASRLRSLLRAKGLAATVVVTLALGIGANAAIFSVVRGVLLRPLVNRDEDRLIYIRQSAPGLGAENTTFSVPEIDDFKSRVTTISAFGDFSTIDFTMIGLGGEPRVVQGGRRRRLVLRGDGPSPGARPPARTRHDDGPDGGGRGGPDPPLLEHVAQQRPDRDRQDHPPRSAHRHRGRRPRAVGALSGRHRDHRERRDQPASPRGDDGHQPHAPDDGAVRPPRARRDARSGARRADRGARRHDARAPRGVLGKARTSS